MNNIKLIDDNPSAVDEFEGGAHDRVATALVDIITTTDGGKAIGLEGSWGSGKSSVIDIAKAKLLAFDQTSDRHHVLFLFDTWAHQGDPILRVFLDELIRHLHAANAIDQKYWEEKLEQLRSRRRRVTETKAKKLTWPARVAVLVLPLLPGAYILLQKTSSFWLVFSAICLIALPYLSMAITWLSWRNWSGVEGHWYQNKKSKKDRSVLWAFTNQTDQEVTDQLIREEEATTVEFNAIFDELVRNAGGKSKKLIIVLDNLDRLPANLIRDIWAVMRNFFAASPNDNRLSALTDVWLIVPFDREHIETVFAQDGHKKSAEQIAPGFIEKTFEIVLRVAPPLVSNWKSYLQSKLNAALGEAITEAQAYKIFKLFDLARLSQKEVVTPRQIKSFVNSIAAQIKQWGATIPAEYQALYILNRSKIAKDISLLQQSSLLDANTGRYVESWEWQKYLSAAHFNVDPQIALELLLGQEIERALTGDQPDALGKLTGTSGFELILHSTIVEKIEDWVKSDPILLFTSATTVAKLTIQDKTTRAEIWDRLGAATFYIDKPLDDQKSVKDGLVALVENSEDANCQRVARSILNALQIPVQEEQEDGDVLFELVDALHASALKRLPVDEVNELFSKITVEGTPHRAFYVAEGCAKNNRLSFASFRPVRTATELSVALVEQLKSAELATWLMPCVSGLLQNPKSVAWPAAITAIRDRLQTKSPQSSPKTACELLDLLRSMGVGAAKATNDALEQLSATGSLHGLVEIGRAANDRLLIADALFEIIIRKKNEIGGPNEHPQYGSLQAANALLEDIKANPGKHPDIISALADLAGRNQSFSEFASLAISNNKPNELFRATLRSLVEKQNYSHLVTSDVLKNFSAISQVLGPALTEKFAKYFATWNIDKPFEGDSWRAFSPEYIAISNKLSTAHATKLNDSLKAKFSALSAEEWFEIFKEEAAPLALLSVLTNVSGHLEFENAFFDALKMYAQQLIDGNLSPSGEYDWPNLTQLLGDSWKPSFYKWLRDRILERSLDASTLEVLFSYYGDAFEKYGDLGSRASDVVRNILDPLLTEPTAGALTLLSASASAFRDVLKKTDSDVLDMVSKRLLATINDATKSAEEKEKTKKLAEELGISLPQEPEEKEDSSDAS